MDLVSCLFGNKCDNPTNFEVFFLINPNIFIGKAADALGGITGTIVIGSEAQASADNQLVIGSGSYPVGTFAPYTGAAFETWEIIVNGNPVKLMVAP